MGLIIKRYHGNLGFTGIAKMSIVAFLASMSAAIAVSVWAIYIDSFVDSASTVGLISAFLTFVAFVSFFVLVPIIEKFNKAKLFAVSLIFISLSYLAFAFVENLYVFLAVGILAMTALSLRIITLGILVKDISPKNSLSRNEGLKFTFINIAFLLGPLIAAYILASEGIGSVFIMASIFAFLGLLFFVRAHINDSVKSRKIDKAVLKNFFSYFKKKERVLVYVLSGGVSLWWGMIYLFVPLYIVRTGLAESWVGYFLFAVAVPLILLEYYFAKSAGLRGFKRIFRAGFLIAAGFAIGAFFAGNVYLALTLLIFGSIGLAMLEPTFEAYFFDVLKNNREEYKYYGPYNTTFDVFDILGKVLGSLLLIFLPFKFIFLLFGGLMFLMFLLSFFVKDVIEAKLGKKHRKI